MTPEQATIVIKLLGWISFQTWMCMWLLFFIWLSYMPFSKRK